MERAPPVPPRVLPPNLQIAMDNAGLVQARELADIVAACQADFIAADNPQRRRDTSLLLDMARKELDVKAQENRRTLIKLVVDNTPTPEVSNVGDPERA